MLLFSKNKFVIRYYRTKTKHCQRKIKHILRSIQKYYSQCVNYLICLFLGAYSAKTTNPSSAVAMLRSEGMLSPPAGRAGFCRSSLAGCFRMFYHLTKYFIFYKRVWPLKPFGAICLPERQFRRARLPSPIKY